LAQALGHDSIAERLLRNIYFDTCVYHQPGIDLLAREIPEESVLFAPAMIGAVRGIDPETGPHCADTRRYLEATPHLNDEERALVFEGNARRVSPRLDAALVARGRQGRQA